MSSHPHPSSQPRTIDSNLPRFSQVVQAAVLAVAFVLDARWVVPLMAVILSAAAIGGPSTNLFARVYKALPVPPGVPEPSAPPRFAQSVGMVFLWIASFGLLTLEPDTTAWWVVGWGPALVVAVLAALAATTSF